MSVEYIPMSKFRYFWLLLLVSTLSGCAHGIGKALPYDAWRLGFLAPNYMEVWIETADAVDVHERVYRRAMSGLAAIQTPPASSGDPRGWPERPGVGAGKHVIGADLPRLIYVRWQSLAEPQTYEVYIPITAETRQQMLEPEKVTCRANSKPITDYRKALTIGLAPGGIAKAWIMGPCLHPIEVTRVEGQVVTLGPSLGRNAGRYALSLEPVSKAYIDQHGIPYGSW